MIIIYFQAYNIGLQRRWIGAMDGNIDLTVQIFVQGEISKLTLEAEETPGLFFIGGEFIVVILCLTINLILIYRI